jgi:hypothetical protein
MFVSCFVFKKLTLKRATQLNIHRNIQDEFSTQVNGTNGTLSIAAGINDFLHTRR